MYLLFVVQEESSYAEKFSTLKEAKESFDDVVNDEDYNIAAAIYDFDKSSRFGISDYGFDGEPIEQWHNDNW